MSLATLEGAASINNTYTLGMFMFIIYYQGTEPSMRCIVALCVAYHPSFSIYLGSTCDPCLIVL